MPTPSHLGKYEITDVLGHGAMGVVHKGFDPGIRRAVAIKTIRRELIQDDRPADTVLARFRNEARAAGRLSHSGIVAVHDYGEDAEVAYIAMEYVEGNSLREYFGRGTRFAERDAVSIMCQLLEALAHAHEHGVWHRDIKPANLIVMMNGRVKVADFGIARIEASDLTQTGTVLGSPGYMAPEQFAGAGIDHRADIFAAGVVFYQLLTNTRPFVGTAAQIAYAVCHSEVPKPSVADPGHRWDRYDAILAKALAKKPEDRYQSAEAFRAAILDAHAAPASPTVSEDSIITEILRPAAAADPSRLSLPQSVPRRPTAAQVNAVQPWEWAIAAGVVTLLAAVVWYAISRTAALPPPAGEPSPAASAVPSAPRTAQADQEMVFWELVRNTSNPLELEAYLARYPDGAFAPIARARLAKLAAGGASARGEAEGSDAATTGTTPPTAVRTDAIEPAGGAARKPVAPDGERGVTSARPGSEPAPTAARPQPDREALFWDSVRDSSDPAELEAYLAKYPDGMFAPLARARLAALAPAEAKRPAEADRTSGPQH